MFRFIHLHLLLIVVVGAFDVLHLFHLFDLRYLLHLQCLPYLRCVLELLT